MLGTWRGRLLESLFTCAYIRVDPFQLSVSGLRRGWLFCAVSFRLSDCLLDLVLGCSPTAIDS